MSDTEQAAIEADNAEMNELGLTPAEPEVAEQAEPTPEAAPADPTPTEEEEEEEGEEPKEPSDEEDPTKQAPTKKTNPFKAFKEKLQTEFEHERTKLQEDFDAKLDLLRKELSKPAPSADAVQETEDAIKALSEDLKLDPEKTKRFIEVARKGIETLTPEDRALLQEARDLKATRETELAAATAKEAFETEWSAVLPSLKAQYPNASDEQITAAKAKMTELAKDEKFAGKELDYVLFKNADDFKKALFSPKQKTFETSRPAPDGTEEYPEFDPNMTPAQFEAWEKREAAMLADSPGDKVRITTRDEFGHVVERSE